MFNENTFKALDWLLDEARLHGLRVVLSFCDNWKYPGGRWCSWLCVLTVGRYLARQWETKLHTRAPQCEVGLHP